MATVTEGTVKDVETLHKWISPLIKSVARKKGAFPFFVSFVALVMYYIFLMPVTAVASFTVRLAYAWLTYKARKVL